TSTRKSFTASINPPGVATNPAGSRRVERGESRSPGSPERHESTKPSSASRFQNRVVEILLRHSGGGDLRTRILQPDTPFDETFDVPDEIDRIGNCGRRPLDHHGDLSAHTFGSPFGQ